MVTICMAQRAANWRNTHTHLDRMHSRTHWHQQSYNHVMPCEAPAQLFQNLESIFILQIPEGWGANRNTRRNPPDSLPANRHHVLEKNPHPLTLLARLAKSARRV